MTSEVLAAGDVSIGCILDFSLDLNVRSELMAEFQVAGAESTLGKVWSYVAERRIRVFSGRHLTGAQRRRGLKKLGGRKLQFF